MHYVESGMYAPNSTRPPRPSSIGRGVIMFAMDDLVQQRVYRVQMAYTDKLDVLPPGLGRWATDVPR